MATKYEYEVEMTCGGCSGALNRILDRHRGQDIENHNVDLETKRVWVETSKLDKDQVQAILEKSGKAVKYVGTTTQ